MSERKSMAAALALLALIFTAGPGGLLCAEPPAKGPEAAAEDEDCSDAADGKSAVVYPSDFNGWDWVYQGIAHGQLFEARGAKLRELKVRVAKLNDAQPEAALEVEVRDESLKKIYLHGTIAPREAGREFRWAAPELDHNAPLEAGKRYILLFHSQDTSNRAPWVVNQVYKDIYPKGRQIGEPHDIFFYMRFANGRSVRVGPELNVKAILPINSGSTGGTGARGPLALYHSFPMAGVCRGDPVGPLPKAERVPGGEVKKEKVPEVF